MPLYKVLPPTRPNGEPLHALVRPKGEKDSVLERWARMVGRVHGAKDRKGVAVEFADVGDRDEGEYAFDEPTGTPIVLRAPSSTDAPECAFVHALGHYLDQQHLGEDFRFASETDPAVRAVVQAARAAPSLAESIAFIEALGRRIAEAAPIDLAGPDGTRFREREIHARHMRLLSDRETFARAYTQYVAEMVRPPAMRMQIARRMAQVWDAGAFPPFWTPGEFAPIGRLMHGLLIEKGLVALKDR